MMTQKKLDEMKIKAEQEGKERADAWRLSFMGNRHPNNMPEQMARPMPNTGQAAPQDQQGGLNG